jgi:hypothetical protein
MAIQMRPYKMDLVATQDAKMTAAPTPFSIDLTLICGPVIQLDSSKTGAVVRALTTF